MTAADKQEVAALVAQAISELDKSQANNWFQLADSWGPAIAVPVICLFAVGVAAWRGFPKLLAYWQKEKTAQQDRDDAREERHQKHIDKLQEDSAVTIRELAGEIKALRHAIRDALSGEGVIDLHPEDDEKTATMRFKRRRGGG